jgi:hypothetical protein
LQPVNQNSAVRRATKKVLKVTRSPGEPDECSKITQHLNAEPTLQVWAFEQVFSRIRCIGRDINEAKGFLLMRLAEIEDSFLYMQPDQSMWSDQAG